MYKIVLNTNQLKLIDLIKLFNKDYYLVGWTAIALNLNHRKSIDFDLFSSRPIKHNKIIDTLIKNWYKIEHTLVNNSDELTIIILWVKITFLYYPFSIKAKDYIIADIIKSPSLLELASMKAYAMWRRSKWKDYVDMYFLFKNWFSIKDITTKSNEIFLWAFDEKLFRQQLCYYDDIDYSEEVDYIWKSVKQEEIKNYLSKLAIIE
jgi:hypothetical protein